MEQVTLSLKFAFILITLLTVYLFYRASNQSRYFLFLIVLWMLIQAFLGLTNFYLKEFTKPPRFLFLIIPPTLLIMGLFLTVSGRKYINSFAIKKLTLLHFLRIPVEISLYFLFIAQAIPQIMTFEGRNFDILAGLTAPLIYFFGLVKNKFSNYIIIWNILGLGLLLNIVMLAILSAKTPFQQFAFEQPNIAVAYFPFNWLPSVVVPLVLFSYLASLKQLIINKTNTAHKLSAKAGHTQIPF